MSVYRTFKEAIESPLLSYASYFSIECPDTAENREIVIAKVVSLYARFLGEDTSRGIAETSSDFKKDLTRLIRYNLLYEGSSLIVFDDEPPLGSPLRLVFKRNGIRADQTTQFPRHSVTKININKWRIYVDVDLRRKPLVS